MKAKIGSTCTKAYNDVLGVDTRTRELVGITHLRHKAGERLAVTERLQIVTQLHTVTQLHSYTVTQLRSYAITHSYAVTQLRSHTPASHLQVILLHEIVVQAQECEALHREGLRRLVEHLQWS